MKDPGWRERHPLIVKEPGYCFGKAALGNSRVRVNNVIGCARQGHTKAQILEEDYPDLTEAQVEAAFAYYREFPREIDAELARDECSELILAASKVETLRSWRRGLLPPAPATRRTWIAATSRTRDRGTSGELAISERADLRLIHRKVR